MSKLITDAKLLSFIMENISYFEPQDIEGDDVELRFELDGVDTGTDISLVEQCRKASGVINALIAALEQSQQPEEVAELLRDKVKRLESDLWDKEQLRKVYSEKSFDLEQTISSMRHEHAKSQSWLAGQVREMEDALCKLLPGSQYMDEPDGGDVSPLEQVTRMVADYRNRIAELEASQSPVKLPSPFWYDDKDADSDILVIKLSDAKKVLRAAGIAVQGDE